MIRASALLEKIKNTDWKTAAEKNRYALISVIIVAAYLYVSFFAISFIVSNARRAFTVNEETAQSRVVTFDIASFEKIKHRLNLK